MKFITGFLRSDAKPENIRLIPKVLEVTDSAAGSAIHRIDGTEIALGDTKTIQDNMKILSQVLENAGVKNQALDVSGFLTKNINLD